jgi:hypothetical protein
MARRATEGGENSLKAEFHSAAGFHPAHPRLGLQAEDLRHVDSSNEFESIFASSTLSNGTRLIFANMSARVRIQPRHIALCYKFSTAQNRQR